MIAALQHEISSTVIAEQKGMECVVIALARPVQRIRKIFQFNELNRRKCVASWRFSVRSLMKNSGGGEPRRRLLRPSRDSRCFPHRPTKRISRMRKLLIAGLALAGSSFFLADVKPAAAGDYPWCAYYTGPNEGTNCGFVSQRQCLATVHGVGGFCRVNPWHHVPVYPVHYYGWR
jgi:hypothetical protein